ncbi:MAG TPA: MFS transporter [Microbacteriaceae bacterium]|nr:MFS transporter [Microbacteriaceae bacterium]
MTPRAQDPGQGAFRAALPYLPVGLALLVIQLDFFDLNLAIPRIAEELGVPVTDLQWLVSGYMLSLGALFIPAGKIGDLIGRKRTILIGLAIFGAMSLASGLAPSAPLLIGFRILQGIGAGLIMPNAFALVGATTAPGVRPKVMGILLAVAGVGTALGPILGGLFTATIGWRWLFFINVPAVVIAILASKWIPEYFVGQRRQSLRRLDWVGTILIVAGLAFGTLGVDNITNLGPGSWLTWGPFVIGLVLLVAFAMHLRRAANPLVAPSLFRDAPFMLMGAAGSALNLSVAVVTFTATMQVQTVDGYAPEVAGLMFLGSSIGVALSGPAAGWLTSRFGARSVLAVTMIGAVVAIVLVSAAPNLPVYIVALGLAGFCGGLGWAVAQVGGQSYLPPERQGEGAGLLSMFMVVAGGLAVVVAGVVIEAIAGIGKPTTASLDWTLYGLAGLVAVVAVLVFAATPRKRKADQNAIADSPASP